MRGVAHDSRVAVTNFRVRTDGVQGNQVHSITVQGLGIPQTDFQPIPMPRSFLSLDRVRTGGVQGNQIHSSTLWTLGIQKMYMGTLGYLVLIIL